MYEYRLLHCGTVPRKFCLDQDIIQLELIFGALAAYLQKWLCVNLYFQVL